MGGESCEESGEAIIICEIITSCVHSTAPSRTVNKRSLFGKHFVDTLCACHRRTVAQFTRSDIKYTEEFQAGTFD